MCWFQKQNWGDFNKSRLFPINSLAPVHSWYSILLVNWDGKGSRKMGSNCKTQLQCYSPLPETPIKLAVERGAEWYKKARFFNSSRLEGSCRVSDTLKLPVGPLMDLNLPSGDGSLGVWGHYSYIELWWKGQPYRYWFAVICVERQPWLCYADDIKGNRQNETNRRKPNDFCTTLDIFKNAQ